MLAGHLSWAVGAARPATPKLGFHRPSHTSDAAIAFHGVFFTSVTQKAVMEKGKAHWHTNGEKEIAPVRQ